MKTVNAVALAVLLLGGRVAHALNFVSVAPGNWNQTSTWACTPQPCTNRIPGSAPGDSVTIGAGHTIVMNYAIPAGNELTSFTNNGTLTMATGSTANLRLGAGTHTSAGPIEFGGGIVGTSGTILQINANSSITAALTLTRITLRNAATLTSSITRTSSRTISLDDLGVIENQSGAVFEDQNTGDSFFSSNGGSGRAFNNAGTLRKTGAGAMLSFSSVIPLNNSGTVTSSSGTIEVRGGTSTGTFSGSGSGQVLFAGTHTMNGATFGSGVNVATSSLLTGSGITILSGSTVTWSAGGMKGTGSEATTVAAGATLRITGDVSLDARKLVNNGTVTVASAGVNRIMNLENGATIENQSGAVWDDQNGSNFSFSRNVGSGAAFNNAGTLRKTGAAPTLSFSSLIALNNSGTVTSSAGTIEVRGGTSTGAFSGSGSGQVLFAGTHTMNGVVFGNGVAVGTSSLLTGSGMTVPSGITLTWSGGGMRGTGSEATTIASGGVLRITGDVSLDARKLVNNGTVTVASAGVNRIMNLENGATIENQTGALWDDQNGTNFTYDRNVGTGQAFNNAGTLRKSGAASSMTLVSAIALNNSGTIEALSGRIQINGSYSHTGGTVLLNGGNITWSNAVTLGGGTLRGTGTAT
ncbi:MAG TPA: hypothetical protein VNL91_09350, partial [Thermoanaerobaculia bacterium]|nr:hypothetical protein [Thermoanaerobaculia bacterium]